MNKVTVKNRNNKALLAYQMLHPVTVFNDIYSTGKCFGKDNHQMPASGYMCDVIKQFYDGIILSDEKYNLAFDSFEYLNGLLYASTHNDPNSNNGRYWGPVGYFCLRRFGRYSFSDGDKFLANNEMIDYDKLVEAGFWDRKKQTLDTHKKIYDEWVKTVY